MGKTDNPIISKIFNLNPINRHMPNSDNIPAKINNSGEKLIKRNKFMLKEYIFEQHLKSFFHESYTYLLSGRQE